MIGICLVAAAGVAEVLFLHGYDYDGVQCVFLHRHCLYNAVAVVVRISKYLN